MAIDLESAAIEMELAGVGHGWTDVTDDVRMEDGVRWSYGIRGAGPLDRVAATGTLTFSLNNAATNSAGLVGYYTPGHVNARSGFDVGARVRVRLSYDSATYTRFLGRLSSLQPLPGTALERKTVCTAYDWMDEAARFKLIGIPTQLGKRSDELIQTILDAMPVGPASTSLATGVDTYEYALDSTRDEDVYALTEFQKIAQSEGGFVYVLGDGGLRFASRHTRPAIGTNEYTLDNSMSQLVVQRSRDLVFNRLQVVAHPRATDNSVVTLFTLQSTMRVLAGETATLFGGYVDPNQKAARVGGFDMVTPVASTDYAMNAAEDGSGVDVTASFSVSVSFGGNGFYATITNTTASTAFVTLFRIRGKGIYDFENAIAIAEDTTSQQAYGLNVLPLDLPYQNSPQVAAGLAKYYLNTYKALKTYAQAMTFSAHRTETHMLAALLGDVGTRVGVREDVTGVNDESGAGFFVNAVDGELMSNNRLTMTWTLAPADVLSVWVLGTSALGVDARLATV